MVTKQKLVVLASGNGSNLQAILDAQDSGRLNSQTLAVISDQPQAFALERAQKKGIPTRLVLSKGRSKLEFHEDLQNTLKSFAADWVVCAGFMRILPPAIIQDWPLRIVNLHPALLPAFPGLQAVRQALDAGVKIAGCTVHFVDAGVDTGPILAQACVSVEDADTEASLTQKIHALEHETLIETLSRLESHKVVLQGRRVLLRTF